MNYRPKKEVKILLSKPQSHKTQHPQAQPVRAFKQLIVNQSVLLSPEPKLPSLLKKNLKKKPRSHSWENSIFISPFKEYKIQRRPKDRIRDQSTPTFKRLKGIAFDKNASQFDQQRRKIQLVV